MDTKMKSLESGRAAIESLFVERALRDASNAIRNNAPQRVADILRRSKLTEADRDGLLSTAVELGSPFSALVLLQHGCSERGKISALTHFNQDSRPPYSKMGSVLAAAMVIDSGLADRQQIDRTRVNIYFILDYDLGGYGAGRLPADKVMRREEFNRSPPKQPFLTRPAIVGLAHALGRGNALEAHVEMALLKRDYPFYSAIASVLKDPTLPHMMPGSDLAILKRMLPKPNMDKAEQQPS